MTLQEKLAQRIYELLPHKKELEFGCKIRTYFDGVHTITHRHRIGNVKECWGTTTGIYGSLVNDEDIKEIIGQKLGLADVLMAIDTKSKHTMIAGDGSVMNFHNEHPAENTLIKYNLSKDNILDQSDEFCEFVLELLK